MATFILVVDDSAVSRSIVIRSLAHAAKIRGGSTRRRHTCVPPTAVTIQVNVQPLAWNIGSVHR